MNSKTQSDDKPYSYNKILSTFRCSTSKEQIRTFEKKKTFKKTVHLARQKPRLYQPHYVCR
jgi:hypothetical protein